MTWKISLAKTFPLAKTAVAGRTEGSEGAAILVYNVQY